MNGEGIRIRAATEHDRQAIMELAPRLAEGLAPWRDRGFAVHAAERWLTDSLAAAARQDGAVLVAAGVQGVVGVVSVGEQCHFTGETDAYVGELAVADHAARTGIGRALLEAAESWAREHGLRHLTLHTGSANAPARAFYAALGFAEEEVRMTRTLPPPGKD